MIIELCFTFTEYPPPFFFHPPIHCKHLNLKIREFFPTREHNKDVYPWRSQGKYWYANYIGRRLINEKFKKICSYFIYIQNFNNWIRYMGMVIWFEFVASTRISYNFWLLIWCFCCFDELTEHHWSLSESSFVSMYWVKWFSGVLLETSL